MNCIIQISESFHLIIMYTKYNTVKLWERKSIHLSEIDMKGHCSLKLHILDLLSAVHLHSSLALQCHLDSPKTMAVFGVA